MRRSLALILVFVAASCALVSAQPAPAPQPAGDAGPFDLLIRNARLLDGAGNPWVRGDVAVRGDRVVAIGRLGGATARRVIDAAGKYVAPGFIDVHTHAGEGLVRDGLRQGRPLLAQGLTTVVLNPDGGGPVDIAAQADEFEAKGLGPNVALAIGHGSIRRAAMGMADRAPTDAERETMRGLVRRAMEAGAFGLSSGLFYAPGSYADTEEVIDLMRVAGESGGLHTSHIRDEGAAGGLLASVDEIIRIAEATGTRGIVSHMKALGAESWGLSMAAVLRIEQARARGVEVFADQYPYTASSTSLVAALIPRWVEVGGGDAMRARLREPETLAKAMPEIAENLRRRGGPESLVIAQYGPDRALEGLTLGAIARKAQVPPAQAALDMVLRGNASVVSFNMTEADVDLVMRQPWTMSSSDGGLGFPEEGKPHPRRYGAFPRKLARYVRDRQVVGLEFAIRSMTSLPAAVFGFTDRGTLRPGAVADLVMFDLDEVQDTATYEDPHQIARGMALVVVNGAIVLEQGTFTDAMPGRVLRR